MADGRSYPRENDGGRGGRGAQEASLRRAALAEQARPAGTANTVEILKRPPRNVQSPDDLHSYRMAMLLRYGHMPNGDRYEVGTDQTLQLAVVCKVLAAPEEHVLRIVEFSSTRIDAIASSAMIWRTARLWSQRPERRSRKPRPSRRRAALQPQVVLAGTAGEASASDAARRRLVRQHLRCTVSQLPWVGAPPTSKYALMSMSVRTSQGSRAPLGGLLGEPPLGDLCVLMGACRLQAPKFSAAFQASPGS
jgi:hypothetical protein